MPILDSSIRHIKCDAPECKNEVLYDRKDEKATFENPDNAWLRTTRIVQSADGRNMMYCSDACELGGIKTGKHNLPEAPKVSTATQADVSAAVKLAQAQKAADSQLRSGDGKIQVTD